VMMPWATSNTTCYETSLGRMDVFETLISRSACSLNTSLSSARTWRTTDSLALMYPSSAYAIARASWNLAWAWSMTSRKEKYRWKKEKERKIWMPVCSRLFHSGCYAVRQ
jgi:hypothetical protein